MRMFYVGLCAVCTPLLLTSPAITAENTLEQVAAEYKAENYEEALQLLQTMPAAVHGTSTYFYYLGLCQKQTGDYSAASESFRAALKISPPVNAAALELVSTLGGLERYDEALSWVQWAEQNGVAPSETAYQKGVILSQMQRYKEARQAFTASKDGVIDKDQQADLQIAISFAQEGNAKEARNNLNALVTQYPGSEAASFAKEYEQRITVSTRTKPWNLSLGVNYQYDDNATLVSSIPGVSTDPRKKDDNGFNENLRFEYENAINDNWSTNVRYTLQNNNYQRLHELDIFSHGLTVSTMYRSGNLVTTIPAGITHTTLDYSNYSLQASAKPTLTFIVNPRNLIQTSLGYAHRTMYQNPAEAENNRNAHNYTGQFGYFYLFDDGKGLLNMRGEGSYENTSGSAWRNYGAKGSVDALLPLDDTAYLILSSEYGWQYYFDTSPNRRDTTLVASATFNKKLIDNLYINLQYTFTRAFSSVDLYDYQRNVLSSGFELRF